MNATRSKTPFLNFSGKNCPILIFQEEIIASWSSRNKLSLLDLSGINHPTLNCDSNASDFLKIKQICRPGSSFTYWSQPPVDKNPKNPTKRRTVPGIFDPEHYFSLLVLHHRRCLHITLHRRPGVGVFLQRIKNRRPTAEWTPATRTRQLKLPPTLFLLPQLPKTHPFEDLSTVLTGCKYCRTLHRDAPLWRSVCKAPYTRCRAVRMPAALTQAICTLRELPLLV